MKVAPYDPPAMVQTDRVRGEGTAHYPILRPEGGRAETPTFASVVPAEPERRSRGAVERQVRKFNDAVGLFAALKWFSNANGEG